MTDHAASGEQFGCHVRLDHKEWAQVLLERQALAEVRALAYDDLDVPCNRENLCAILAKLEGSSDKQATAHPYYGSQQAEDDAAASTDGYGSDDD